MDLNVFILIETNLRTYVSGITFYIYIYDLNTLLPSNTLPLNFNNLLHRSDQNFNDFLFKFLIGRFHVPQFFKRSKLQICCETW